MNYEEFKKIAKGMKSIWASDYFLPDKYAIDFWYEILKDLPYDQACLAVTRYASLNSRMPTPADIRENVVDITAPKEDWSSGWEQVIKAIGRYGYYNEHEALESMDEITRTATKRLGWKMICQSEQTELTAIRANFRMIYEQIQQDAKTDAKLSAELKAQIEQITGNTNKRLLK